jgi:transcriptional regulator with XRE-family HTH domain
MTTQPHGPAQLILASRLRALRQEAGISGDALARRAGVSPGTVWGIERGEARCTLDVGERLAAALGLTLGQVIGGAGLDGIEERTA